ncbi:MAG: glycerophosphodiester phosphodiesterase [bacterium]|nr:glycerophosphodiester phosphodiesterase [bacterium]
MNYNGRVILAAHRGDRKHFPENNMPAFEAALRMGADMIETDVHMTRDGKLLELGCRMFTSNDIETADALLRALKRR